MDTNDDFDFVAPEHNRLVSAVSKLDKTQHITEPTRNEPTNLNTEFNLVKCAKKLNVSNLTKVFEDTANHVQISQKLKKSKDISKILRKPLEKPQAERIKRATGYEETKKKIGRWDPVVARSRTVDFVSFPLKTVTTKLQPTQDFLSKLTLKSPLEKELETIDPPVANESSDEEEHVYPMTYQEMLDHRQHIAKFRAQQSYRAAKAKRQSKIKSKKYHRILKKEKLKQQLKEFEELQKTNPEEALKKLEALEKTRALERHTLRHKNTGKWAKSKLVRAKYDKEVRQQLSEQLAVSRGLTKKIKDSDSSDDEDNTEGIPDLTISQDPLNPCMIKSSEKSNTDEFNFGYKKYLQKKSHEHQLESGSDSEHETPTSDPTENFEINNSNLEILKNTLEKFSHGQKRKLSAITKSKSTSKNKLQLKLINKGSPPITKIVSTSKWIVEPVNKDSEEKLPNDITSVFESFEKDVTEKIEKKLSKLRKSIEILDRKKFPKIDKKVRTAPTDNLEYLKLKKQKTKPIIDEELFETGTKIVDIENDNKQLNLSKISTTPVLNEKSESNIDPTRFIEVKPKYLNSTLPSSENNFDQLDDDDEQVVPKVNIEEVFEEDDVVASFRQEKEDEINNDKPKEIDLSLPGWGSWGGKGIKAPKRKRNRFILKAPPTEVRRDENKGDIIIKEYKDPKLSKHKVTDIPFPFTSVKEYEASIRLPLGNTFIPENAHKKLIRPNVITKAGTIIEPMDEDELLVPRNRNFKNEAVIKLLGQK